MFLVPLILGIGAILVLVLGTPASAAYAKSMQPSMEPQRPDLHKESSKAHKPTVPKQATPTEPPSAEEPVPAQPNLSLVVQRTGQVTSMALRDEEDRKKDAKKDKEGDVVMKDGEEKKEEIMTVTTIQAATVTVTAPEIQDNNNDNDNNNDIRCLRCFSHTCGDCGQLILCKPITNHF